MNFGGVQAQLFYVSSTQINFEVPGLGGTSQTSVSVTVGGSASATRVVTLGAYSPGLFSLDGSGSGQGAILNAASQFVDTANPAIAGSTVVEIFGTGLGDGTVTPSVTIGGIGAIVTYAGTAPGFAGLNQVNALVPANVPPGAAVPVSMSIGGLNSNTVSIAVAGSTNPVPAITSLAPAFGAVGAASEQVAINGVNFVAGSAVTFNGVSVPATFVNGGQLTIMLSGTQLATPGAFPITVTNPGGGVSNTVQLIEGPGFNGLFADSAGWLSFAHDAIHTALSLTQTQALNRIRWQTPVDLNPQFVSGELLIHYGSPLATAANTIVVPVKTGAAEGFRVEAHDGTDGTLIWSMTSDYVLPPHDWTPEFGPALTRSSTVYFPGAGGTVYYRQNADSPAGTQGQLTFYGMSNYQANPSAYNSAVMIDTPIVSDPAGDIYFGFMVTGSTPLGLRSGIARIDANGNGTWVPAAAVSGDSTITEVVENCAPALNWNLGILYIAVSDGSSGYLLALNSNTLQTMARGPLYDPLSGRPSYLSDDGTASPFVGPDGDVYYGVLENPANENHYRGWLLHFDSGLSQNKIAGDFGWDDTPSLVPTFMVPSYSGTSSYLIMTKYNDYAASGGTGLNRVAVLDPNATETDTATGATVMKEIATIAGPTPNTTEPGVKEWCINTAAVDPATPSILVNSEDGKLYRWNLATNSFSQQIILTPGLGEAYTPTIIGPDGAVYAINNATLFAVGQ